MILMSIAEIIENAGVVSTCFVNNMPAAAKSGVLLRDPFAGFYVNHELPNYFKGKFMLITRAAKDADAEKLMDDAIAAIVMENQELTLTERSMKVNYIRQCHLPLTYAPTPAGLVEKLVNIDVNLVLL